jgi:hypothetical protein
MLSVQLTQVYVTQVLHILTAGLLLCDWLRSIENEPPGTALGHDEQKVLNLVKELLAEADISVADGERLSAAALNVWAGTLDEVWVWGRNSPNSKKKKGLKLTIIVFPVLAKVLRRLAEEIQDAAHVGQRDTGLDSISRMDPPSISYINP